MRIGLFNTNPAWGGGERWFFDAGRALEARGHEVVRLGRSGTPLFRRWGRGAVDSERFGRRRVRALDVLVCNSGREVRRALRLVGRRAGPAVVLRRGLDRPLRDAWYRRRAWRRLSAILVNSRATGETVAASLPWFPRSRIRRIYNPVTLDPVPDVPRSGPFRVGIVGRLVRQKGADVLLEALARLRELDWTLDIVGDGALRRELERHARSLGIRDRCRFRGEVRDVAPVFASLDLVVVPSRYEGFCFAAAEAALAGRPVVATRVSSLPEVVLDGETGVLVPPDDPTALARAVRALANDPARAAALGDEARARAKERFSPARLHDALESFVEEAAAWPPVGDGSAEGSAPQAGPSAGERSAAAAGSTGTPRR